MAATSELPVLALVDIKDIVIADRSRDLDEAWVAALAEDISQRGLLHPVTLLLDGKETRLVSGAHRTAAHVLLGLEKIPAIWSNASSLAEAKVLEITENIVRRELSILDRARHLFDLKAAYEELHPETKAGVAGANAKHGNANEIFSFAEDAAQTLGLSARSIQLSVALWKGLSAHAKATITGTWLANHGAGLNGLSKERAATQKKVLDMLFPGDGKAPKAASVADALYLLENGRLLNSFEKRMAGASKVIGALKDEEFDAIMTLHEERVMAWMERHLGGEASDKPKG